MKLPTMKLPAMKFTLFSPPAASVVEPSPTDLNSAAPAKRTSKIFSFNEKGAPTEQEKSLCADVSLVDGVDQVIANKSDTEACDLLRGMILNLSNEVDDCCGRLAQKESQVAVLEEENASNSQEARDKLFSLILALQKATGDSIKVTLDAAQVLSSEEASSLVIASLTDKVSELSVQNSQLVERMETMQDIMEDFESENEACLHKMDALEMQFKSINKTRQRVVSRLVDRSKDPMLKSPGRFQTIATD